MPHGFHDAGMQFWSCAFFTAFLYYTFDICFLRIRLLKFCRCLLSRMSRDKQCIR